MQTNHVENIRQIQIEKYTTTYLPSTSQSCQIIIKKKEKKKKNTKQL